MLDSVPLEGRPRRRREERVAGAPRKNGVASVEPEHLSEQKAHVSRSMRSKPGMLLLTLGATWLPAVAWAASPAAEQGGTARLIVGTKEAPPFAMRSEDGSWYGLSIDLWRGVAAELGLEYEFRERDLEGLIDGLTDGSLDASVAALTVTAAREARIDFSHPFHTSGLGIAVAAEQRSVWLTVLRRLISPAFLKVLLTLAAVLLVAGALVWLFERRPNQEQFGGGLLAGLAAAFWWSAVTMTTVGYGDKAPKTAGGRIVALVWMFTAVIIISGFTATIASTLTVSQLESPVKGPEDLPRVRVATVAASTSETYLRDRQIRYTAYDTPITALDALTAGNVDAVVYDAPILRYLALNAAAGTRVLPQTFDRQDYGIGLPENSSLREPISRSLLRQIGEPEWQDVLIRYLGR